MDVRNLNFDARFETDKYLFGPAMAKICKIILHQMLVLPSLATLLVVATSTR
jgi:hypothetical protein